MVKTYIVTLTWNNPDDFAACTRSVACNSGEDRANWVVVDNGSDKDNLARIAATIAWLKTLCGGVFDHVLFLKNATNRGIPVAQNQALDAIALGEPAEPEDYGVILLDADTIVHPGWIGKLAGYAAEHPDVGLVGGAKSPRGVACPVYHNPNGRWYVHDDSQASGFMEGESVDFACVYWRPELLKRGLRFDEGYEIYDGYDQDTSFRVRSWGYRIVQIDAGVDHYASSVMKGRGYAWAGGGKHEWDLLREKNRARFVEKWKPFLKPHRATITEERKHMAAINKKLVEEAGDRKAVPGRTS